MNDSLVIGAIDLPGKDETVLRALVRLLDCTLGVNLRFDDDVSHCDVVFVSAEVGVTRALMPSAVTVTLLDPSNQAACAPDRLFVPCPLRMSGVIGVLQAVLSRLAPAAPVERIQWQGALFACLREALRRGGRSVLAIGAGKLLLLDTVTLRLQSAVPLEQLIGQAHRAGAWRAASAVDEEMLHGAAVHPLHEVLWRLSAAMAAANAAPLAPSGAWRLQRWPSAAGLMTAGHPRLAALLTQRAHTADELMASTALPSATVHAFLATCEALGLGVRDATHTPQAVGGAVAPGWLGQLRERLKLW